MTNNISWRDKDSSDLHVLRDGEKLRVGVMMRARAIILTRPFLPSFKIPRSSTLPPSYSMVDMLLLVSFHLCAIGSLLFVFKNLVFSNHAEPSDHRRRR